MEEINDIVAELRELIHGAAPDPELARPVLECKPDEPLDGLIPFSSLIVLGVVVAVEDRYEVVVTRENLAHAATRGTTLQSLAKMVADLRRGTAPA